MENAVESLPDNLVQIAGRSSNKHKIVSLFSGCGGMDIGFTGGFKFAGRTYRKFPADIIFANDIDKYACQAYRENIGLEIVEGDIGAILSGDDMPERADILLGGFPCQDFSHAGRRKGFNSERGILYRAMVEVAKKIKPRVFVAENVKGLTTIDGVLETIKRDFKDAGFASVEAYPVECADFGIPQKRARVFIIGWRNQHDADAFTFPTHAKKAMTVKQAIDDLAKTGWDEFDGHTWALAKRRPDLQGNEVTPPDGLAYTVRAEHHMNIQYHYSEERRLSVREAARLQTFPDTFKFGKISKNQGYRMIGNAVPPVMAWQIAREINKVLD